jgi:hypothetical protein
MLMCQPFSSKTLRSLSKARSGVCSRSMEPAAKKSFTNWALSMPPMPAEPFEDFLVRVRRGRAGEVQRVGDDAGAEADGRGFVGAARACGT